MIENITNFTFNHSDQADDLYKVMTATEVKQAFDSRGNELKDKVNEVITQSNTNETEISKRTLSTDFETHKTSGDHDARYSLKSSTYTKTDIDNNFATKSENNSKADKSTTYTKTETNNLVAGVTLGQIPNDSLTEQKMANDMKKDIVGGITSYNEYKIFKDNTTSSLSDLATQTVPHLGTTTNVGDAYSITTTETINANEKFTIKFNANSTTTPTLSINGGTAISILKANGGNAKLYASVYTLFYDGLNFILLGEGGEYGTATADKVLSGYTIGTENGLIPGAMPNKGVFNLGLGVSVPAGYYSGGTTANGKRYLTGNFTTSNNSYTITGLPFRPSIVVIYTRSSDVLQGEYDKSYEFIFFTDQYHATKNSGTPNVIDSFYGQQYSYYEPSSQPYTQAINTKDSHYITSNGFTTKIADWNQKHYWVAIE